MNVKELATGDRKNILICVLMLISLFILLPTFIKVVRMEFAPYTDDEVIITTVSYESKVDGKNNRVVGNLFQPAPKFSDKKYPAIIACHGFLMGVGKEQMNRWCVELTKRGFVVLSIDVPGNGMSIGEMDMTPRADYESVIIKDGIKYLQGKEFVKERKIGLIGISYGAGIVAMSSGKLDHLVDATVAINGFMNLTNWLIEGILDEADFKISVRNDYIELKKVNGKKIDEDNIKEILKMYQIFTGDDDSLDDLIIPDTNRLDRDFLKKFDAVEYLPEVQNGSMMFIHSKRDKTFHETNQSGQGYAAILRENKTAVYIRVNDNHQLMDDPKYRSDYCIINFFEERLKGVDLGDDHEDDFDKYTQKRDIELTISKEFGFLLFYEIMIVFLLSLIPVFFIISIIVYNKKVATKRAQKEEEILEKERGDEIFVDLSFGRGSYFKTIFFLISCYIIAYIAIMGMALGFFSELMAGSLIGLFYLTLFLTLYYLPDKAEVDLWDNLKGKDTKSPYQHKVDDVKIFDVNSLLILLGIIIIVIGAIYIGSMFSTPPPFFQSPLEQIFRPMLIIGGIFLIFGIYLIYILERGQNEGIKFKEIDWERYSLSKYQILKSITFGSALFLAFMFQWNVFAFYAKFPMMMGPHSFYYLFMAMAVVCFFGGTQLLIKIFKEKVLKDNISLSFPEERKKETLRKILVEVIGVVFGIIIIGATIYFVFYPLLNTDIFGNLTLQMVYLFVLLFLLTAIYKIFCVDRGILGATIFVPLAIFDILAFLLHI